ncbi:MAG: glycosyltransferase family 4 protein [Hyphomonadaceae bacterium]
MASFTFVDNGLPFDGLTPALFPLGGAESAVVSLAEALAGRGHSVTVLNKCAAPLEHKGVLWRPLDGVQTVRKGLVIVNRDPRLLKHVENKRPAVLWLHNDARYLRKWRHALPLLRFRLEPIFLSKYHASTWPFQRWWPAKHIIPLGVDPSFRRRPLDAPPPPRAVFASNPERGLAPLLDLWVNRIHPAAPQAELHLFTRAAFYGVTNKAARLAEPIIAAAASLQESNVVLHEMRPRSSLAGFYQSMRAMLYWGDAAHAETFCLSIAEAQASAVPCVARPTGAIAERINHGHTGFLEQDGDKFSDAAISLLTDDSVWRRCRAHASRAPRSNWSEIAAQFEMLHG